MSVPRFWREIPQRYTLAASRCGVCAEVHFPPRTICPTCRRDSVGHIEDLTLSGDAAIVEWTRVHKGAPGYGLQTPYLVALLKAAEGPMLIGQIVDSPNDSIVAGAAVHAVFRRIASDGASGILHYGTKWRITK